MALSRSLDNVAAIVAANPDAVVSRTNYTVTIRTPNRTYFLADAATSQKCFRAYAKVKRDVLESGIVPPPIRTGAVKYYRFSEHMPTDAWSVDIKQAYPSALYDLGYITADTREHLRQRLTKPERLKCVGMLASRKFIQTFEGGRLRLSEMEEAETRPVFFHVCERIGSLMEALHADVAPLLSYWVDGALVGDPEPYVKYLDALGYDSTVERVENIHYTRNGKYLFYTKGGKTTYLCVPQRVEFDDGELLQRIQQHDEDDTDMARSTFPD